MSEPCWEIDRGPWESPHFPTRAEAEAERQRYAVENDGTEDGPVHQLPYVCTVDGEDEDGFMVHEVPAVPDTIEGEDR